ncbi:MAG TPA: carbon-nitrogen hydrolase family protein [Gammaproteobacteria bacterium]|nr:carbon-nitrogen hydrolase family protein [Gammaproteobacteria bacterium]
MKAAAVQMTSTRDIAANLREAGRLVAEAASQDAELVVLPENFSFLGATDADRVAAIEPVGDGPAQHFLAETAKRYGLFIVGGTIPIRDAGRDAGGRAMQGAIADGGQRASSRSLLVGPDGKVAAHYDKIHLFDVDIPGRPERYSESATTLAGTRVVTAATPHARIGMTVCYDIRFPALFHRLSVLGTDVLVVPAAFTVPTGEVHWRPLLTARAIESLAYVVAAGQWGEHDGGRKTYGHSLILGPWGELLAELPAGPGVVLADLDMIRLAELRQRFPTVRHRREL